jgi:ribonuclease Z
MPSPFDAHLVNGPFGDPALYVDLPHARRALLFDMGDLAALPPRKLLRVTDVLVSHTHMDHWSGFDHFLRLSLGREKEVRLFGPPGIAAQVGHKLRAYTWNLLGGYANDLALMVTEVGEAGALSLTVYRTRTGFVPEPGPRPKPGPTLHEEENLRVTAAVLDHGIPCLAFAIEEKAHANVWRNRLEGWPGRRPVRCASVEDAGVAGVHAARAVTRALDGDAAGAGPRVNGTDLRWGVLAGQLTSA